MTSKKIPYVKKWPLLGCVIPFLRDIFYFPQDCFDTVGPIFQMNLPYYHPVFLQDPTHIKHILEKNHFNYVKSNDYETLKLTLGNGLVTSEGEKWKENRKLIQPFVYEDIVVEFIEISKKHSKALIQKWSETKEPFKIERDLKLMALQIACESFFGIKLSEFKIDIVSIIDQLNSDGVKKMRFPRNQIPYSVPTILHQRLKKNLNALNTEIYRLMDKEDESHNLLQLLKNHPKLSKEQVRDEMVTFLIAGYETTANTLQFLCAELGNNTDLQKELRKECTPQLKHSQFKKWQQQLPLLTATIKESMRLYPAAWIIGRQSVEKDTLGDFNIPAKQNIIISVFLLHRLKSVWKNADSFDPSRFLKDDFPKDYYMPFGGGPRVCIGQQLTMLEMIIFSKELIQTLQIKTESPITLQPNITLGCDDISIKVSSNN